MPSSARLPLLCPVCSDPLAFPATAPANRRLACPAGHSFDAARQGYFNFLVGKGTAFEADSAAMVAARATILEEGLYRPLADAVAAAVVPFLSRDGSAVLDSGTGTGHYLRTVLDAAAVRGHYPDALALDISKFALRRAARLNPEAVNVAWDIWRPLPLASGSVDAVTVIFAPRNAGEFARVLRAAGRLVVVTPRPGHLDGIAAVTGMLGIEDGKELRLAGSMAAHFIEESGADIDIPLLLSRRQAADLAFMGPAGHHLDRGAIIGRLSGLPEPVAAYARFRLTVFRPKEPGTE